MANWVENNGLFMDGARIVHATDYIIETSDFEESVLYGSSPLQSNHCLCHSQMPAFSCSRCISRSSEPISSQLLFWNDKRIEHMYYMYVPEIQKFTKKRNPSEEAAILWLWCRFICHLHNNLALYHASRGGMTRGNSKEIRPNYQLKMHTKYRH